MIKQTGFSHKSRPVSRQNSAAAAASQTRSTAAAYIHNNAGDPQSKRFSNSTA